ncbi:MAG: hypothetical protein M1324_00310 [Patescibacteria group bacterium]|nr:hypothetical protein [Patescibacteria group bacterium]
MKLLLLALLYLAALYIADLATNRGARQKFWKICLDFCMWVICAIFAIGLHVSKDLKWGLLLWLFWILAGLGAAKMLPTYQWWVLSLHFGIVIVPSLLALFIEWIFIDVEKEKATCGP